MLDHKEWQIFKYKVSKQMDEVKLDINKELFIIDKIAKITWYALIRNIFGIIEANV